MANSTSRRLAAVLTASIGTLAWLLMAVFGAAPAEAHHGSRLGKGAGGAQAAPRPSPAPAPSATPAPAPAAAQPVVTGSVGATGENVKTIEQRLRALHFFVGAVDTTYDEDTAQAVTAFQKVHGMNRTGSVTADVWNKMASAQDPAPLVPGGGERRVEVDVDRQVLFLYEGNKLAEIVAVSTGSEKPYCENGSCGDAVTPRGDFKIYRQGEGWETGALGSLYNPAYFTGGFAVHGSESVPNYPASHGCVRIPMSVAEWFPSRAPLGTPVYVR